MSQSFLHLCLHRCEAVPLNWNLGPFLRTSYRFLILRNEPSQAEVPGILHEISDFDSGMQGHMHTNIVAAVESPIRLPS